MPNFFWNPVERRMRAFWRLIFQTLLTFIITAIFSIVYFFGIRLLRLGNALSLSTDPSQVAEAVSEMIASDPFFFFVSEAFSFFPILIAIAIAGKWFDKRRFSNFGLHFSRRWWADFFFGLGLGAFLMTAIFIIEFAAGWVKISGAFISNSYPFILSIALGLASYVLVGISEELLSRGYHFINIVEGIRSPRIDRRLAILLGYFISASIFGLMHLGNPGTSVISTINLILAGLFLGIGMLLTGELAIGIGLHITWNFFQGMVFGFPVSGLEAGTTLIAIRQGGPPAWTGGVFGPEAGLMGFGAILIGTVLICAWVRRTRGEIKLHSFGREYLSRQQETEPEGE